ATQLIEDRSQARRNVGVALGCGLREARAQATGDGIERKREHLGVLLDVDQLVVCSAVTELPWARSQARVAPVKRRGQLCSIDLVPYHSQSQWLVARHARRQGERATRCCVDASYDTFGCGQFTSNSNRYKANW